MKQSMTKTILPLFLFTAFLSSDVMAAGQVNMPSLALMDPAVFTPAVFTPAGGGQAEVVGSRHAVDEDIIQYLDVADQINIIILRDNPNLTPKKRKNLETLEVKLVDIRNLLELRDNHNLTPKKRKNLETLEAKYPNV